MRSNQLYTAGAVIKIDSLTLMCVNPRPTGDIRHTVVAAQPREVSVRLFRTLWLLLCFNLIKHQSHRG
ncbi:DUF1496 domain-containing protein [Salmonella enterica subsp. enterica]|nr:DUF1496 domain-containing protein [Salmonella enterica subsp. enterica]